MIDIADFSRRIRRRTIIAGCLGGGGAFFLLMDFMSKAPPAGKIEFGVLGVFALLVGGFFYYLSMELPTKEIMQLAETHNGLLTVSEICTALSINPDVALRALAHLQRLNVATPRWEEIQKNLWEFPDMVKLPVAQAIDLAKGRGGRLSLQDLVASGHSMEVAEQTFDAMAQKGLAQQENGDGGRVLIMESR